MDFDELEQVARTAKRHDEQLETAETSPHLAQDPVSSVYVSLE
ncbi:hypothetical protein [Myxococcus llanfairpwllgwyngyllgogerychwyrndrobwllllantysiliogogogochensis]|nr:hypothetical protein [Myxococcus llanfairpwllgwyngyllgogerychwyrndrobwllllantysiliogogogochensis]